MLGAIAGDIIGSVYERRPIKTTDFPLFHPHCHPTDDSVLTIVLADSILNGKDFVICLKDYFARYPDAGYGGSFAQWAMSMSTKPYNSWGNGSAMRVSPVGFAFNTLEEVLERAEKSAAVTHNHPGEIKGAGLLQRHRRSSSRAGRTAQPNDAPGSSSSRCRPRRHAVVLGVVGRRAQVLDLAAGQETSQPFSDESGPVVGLEDEWCPVLLAPRCAEWYDSAWLETLLAAKRVSYDGVRP